MKPDEPNRMSLFGKKHPYGRLVTGFLLWIGISLVADGLWAQPPAKPAPFLLNTALLQENKEKIRRGDASLSAALTELVAAADQALKRGPYSVIHKGKTPPSGDKHDYMSVGPYWWPDSSKANGLPYIRRDGQINPERFLVKDEGELNDLCDDTHLLALGYYFTGQEKYARQAADLVRVWFLKEETRMNPNLNYGQGIPGITEGRGIGLIDSKELVKLVDAVQLLNGSPAWPAADQTALQGWFRQFLDWMLNSPIGKDEEDEHNNHGTYYDLQAISFALFTGNKELAKTIVEQKTYKRIENQLKEDGSQPHELARTLSWNYSLMNLKGFFGIAQLAENVQLDVWNYRSPGGKSIKQALLWLLPYAEGKKTWEHKQIKAMHAEDLWPLVQVAADHYPNQFPPPLKTSKGNAVFTLTNSLF